MKRLIVGTVALLVSVSACTERQGTEEKEPDINWNNLTITEADAAVNWGTDETQAVTYKETGLPVIYIDTPDGSELDASEEKTPTEGCSIKVEGTDGTVILESVCRTKVRGNSSRTYPKKGYNLKFEKKTSMLGMPKSKKWCLLANWADKSFLRNRTAFLLSERTDLKWTPRSEYAELVLNGTHLGTYQVTESVGIGADKVNLSDDGALLELDTYFDADYKFYSEKKHMPYTFKDPDNPTEAMFQQIQDYVNEFESSLYDVEKLKGGDYNRYIDVDSFIDFILVNEVCGNGELKFPKSFYLSKDKDAPMYAGPVWDFDYETFLSAYSNSIVVLKTTYFAFLLNDPEYVRKLKERWNTLKLEFEKVLPEIDAEAKVLEKSQSINLPMWPAETGSINGEYGMTYRQTVETLKLNLIRKILWMDKYIKLM